MHKCPHGKTLSEPCAKCPGISPSGTITIQDLGSGAIKIPQKQIEDRNATIRRMAAENERLKAIAGSLMDAVTATVVQLRKWANESKAGGWSTHQVKPMRECADRLEEKLSRLASTADLDSDALKLARAVQATKPEEGAVLRYVTHEMWELAASILERYGEETQQCQQQKKT